MFFYVVSRTYAEISSLLPICSGLLSNSPGLIDISQETRGIDLLLA